MKRLSTRKMSICLGICFALMTGLFGSEVSAETYTLEQVNQMRSGVNLPALTGNQILDLGTLGNECLRGIQGSCSFLTPQQLTTLQNIKNNANRGSSGAYRETRSQCLARTNAAEDKHIKDTGLGSSVIMLEKMNCFKIPE